MIRKLGVSDEDFAGMGNMPVPAKSKNVMLNKSLTLSLVKCIKNNII